MIYTDDSIYLNYLQKQNKREHGKIMLETLQDSLDLIIPGTILEYFPVSQGVVGLAGTITSIIGWNAAWPRS